MITKEKNKVKLGVNIDHSATLRQARGTVYPKPVIAAMLAEHAGCDSIVAHLREDRRHIQESDILLIKQAIKIPLNLEMATNKEIVDFALKIIPSQATLVPERRLELTTEGGLDLKKHYSKIEKAVKKLQDKQIKVSLFIDPNITAIDLAKKIGADLIEFNTGSFCEAKTSQTITSEFEKIKKSAQVARQMGFMVACGHGLDYENIKKIIAIKEIEEYNIGHSIVSQALFVGLMAAVEEMIKLINRDKTT